MSRASHRTVRSPSPGPAQPTYRILLVEDDGPIRQLSAKTLVRNGYEVDAVEDSQSGLDALQAHRYDLLITDNRMPGLSGFDLVRKLRAAKMTLPVILASGGLRPEELKQNPWLQPAVTLPKPFTANQMLAVVAAVLPASASVPHPSGIHLRASAKTISAAESFNHWGINE